MKPIVLDASTLILSAKIDLIQIMAKHMRLEISETVRQEALRKPALEDAKSIARLIGEQKIKVEALKDREFFKIIQEDFRLGDGEAETITLAKAKGFMAGVDDYMAIKVCRIVWVPFVSTLSLLVHLKEEGHLTQNQALAKLEKLKGYGWYQNELLNKISGIIKGGEKP